MFNDWDDGDVVDGIYNTICLGMEDWVSSLTTTIEDTFEMHPVAKLLCLKLLSLTVNFFSKISPMM